MNQHMIKWNISTENQTNDLLSINYFIELQMNSKITSKLELKVSMWEIFTMQHLNMQQSDTFTTHVIVIDNDNNK